VSGRSSRPTDSQEKALEGDINDSKAKSDLILSISTSELRQVWNCETSKQLWEKLESIYQSKGLARKSASEFGGHVVESLLQRFA